MPALFDTGTLELLRRRDPRVENLALKHYPPVLCPHVAGEYIHSQLQAQVSKASILQARTFVAAFEALIPTTRTADHYAELRTKLAVAGTILPDPYCWIAAHAVEHGLPLVTTDRIFRQVPGIKVHLILMKRRLANLAPALAGKVVEATTPKVKAAGEVRPKLPGRSRNGSKPHSASAVVFFALYLAQDCLAESSALLENLGGMACGFY